MEYDASLSECQFRYVILAEVAPLTGVLEEDHSSAAHMKLTVHQLLNHRPHQQDNQKQQVANRQGCEVAVAGGTHGLPGENYHTDENPTDTTQADDWFYHCLDGVVSRLKNIGCLGQGKHGSWW